MTAARSLRRRLWRSGLVPARRIKAFEQIGWTASVRQQVPVDSAGEPIPWFTYGAITFLDQVVSTTGSVLEIGGGHSTLWWEARGNLVTVLEADADWAQRLRTKARADITVLPDADEVLAHLAASARTGKSFDVVVVDGVDPRSTYLLAASHLVADGGILVVDNSDRVAYRESIESIQGFHRVDFFGMGPQNPYAWATSVFSRSAIIPRGRRETFSASIDY